MYSVKQTKINTVREKNWEKSTRSVQGSLHAVYTVMYSVFSAHNLQLCMYLCLNVHVEDKYYKGLQECSTPAATEQLTYR